MDSQSTPRAEEMSDAYVRGMEKCCVVPLQHSALKIDHE